MIPNQGVFTVLQNSERWMSLCRQAAVEQCPAKLALLSKQINDLLLIKRYRLENQL